MTVCVAELFGISAESLIRYLAHGFIVFAVLIYFLQTVVKLQPSYGRFYATSAITGLGLNPRLAWFLQESPAFYVPLALLIGDLRCRLRYVNYTLLSFVLVHYLQRAFIYPLLIKGGKPSSLISVISAFTFCVLNGFMQGYQLVCIANYPATYLWNPTFIVGLLIFVTGFVVNLWCDSVLRNLRKPGETGYKIPKGGLFEYVSCANFFGEIVEWWGFAIASWSYPAFAFAVFTLLFLSSKAYLTHRFYLEKFDDYPKARKMVLPFIF